MQLAVVPISPGSNDLVLNLTARLEDTLITIQNFNNGTAPQLKSNCYPPGIQDISSRYSAGAIHLRPAFNLGRYQIVCRFPQKENVWSAFWMWHFDEIDITDIAYYGHFLQNVYKDNYAASLLHSPCCTHMRDCDFCDDIVDHIDCSSFSQCGECDEDNPNVSYQCNYLSDGNWHTIGCEWTPYKVMFYVDGIVTGTVYRYYNLDKTPVIIECGSLLPERVVKENPVFPDIIGRFFRPIVWIVSEGGDDCPSGPDCANPEDLPAVYEVREITIEERAYQYFSLAGCYEVCEDGNICLDLQINNLNGLYGLDGGVQHINALPNPTLSNCQITSQDSSNSGTINNCGPNNICFDYEINGCTNNQCLGISVDLTYPNTGIGPINFTRWLNSQEPKVYAICPNTTITQRDQNKKECICIDPGTFCDITINHDNIQTIASYENGLTCIEVADLCESIEIVYDSCGELIVNEYDIVENSILLESKTKPILSVNGQYQSSLTQQGINYISFENFDICYLDNQISIVGVTAWIDGNFIILGTTNNCIPIFGVDDYAIIEITINFNDCYTEKQRYIIINTNNRYRLLPNPTSGQIYLQVNYSSIPEIVEVINPNRLLITNINGNTIQDIDISSGQTLYFINLTPFSTGTYQFIIFDDFIEQPIYRFIQKM